MLPHRAQILIKEYSRPITRPNWKKGSPHAKLLEQSQPFIDIKDMLINLKHYYNHDYNKIFDDLFMNTLLKHPFNILLQNYGDNVFNMFLGFKPNQLNFYRLCRLIYYLRIVKNSYIPTKMLI